MIAVKHLSKETEIIHSFEIKRAFSNVPSIFCMVNSMILRVLSNIMLDRKYVVLRTMYYVLLGPSVNPRPGR